MEAHHRSLLSKGVRSVNYSIPSELCSLTYVIIDNAILNILESGRDTMLAKIDIKSAFRLLPVHLADRHLLGMKWKDNVYIDITVSRSDSDQLPSYLTF